MIRHTPTAKKAAFLVAYAVSGNVAKACLDAGIHRSTHYDWLETDAKYKERFAYAQQEYEDLLVAEADRRAKEGTAKMKFFKGEPIMVPHPFLKEFVEFRGPGGEVMEREVPVMVPYIEHEYSDVLLMFRLKALNPVRYRDRVDFSGEIDVSVKAYEVYDPRKIGTRSISEALSTEGERGASS